MFEDNSYEPIAEIYLNLGGEPSVEDNQDVYDIYCLCSRVFVEGTNGKEEEALEDPVGDAEPVEEASDHGHSGENTVRFCSSSTESQPLHTPKKSSEEAVSCYCSASHYSTDEHDSLRESSVLHHSDSGADLSESSRDPDWERYWTRHGERLIWESWISKYGTYIDPDYLNSSCSNVQRPAEGEDASFCIQSDKDPDPNRRTSFSGFLENTIDKDPDPNRRTSFSGFLENTIDKDPDPNRTTSFSGFSENSISDEKSSGLDSKQVSIEEEKVEVTPQILVQDFKNGVEEILSRRLSDISETYISVSGVSEDSSNIEDNDRLRLSVYSRCSGSSAPLSATTDSMTNVTRITLSSSDSSYGVDDSSAKSSSIFSSSDSGSSVDQQWHHLWVDHFNEQYYYHFIIFTEKQIGKKDGDNVKSDSGFIIDDSKLFNNRTEPHRQESIDDVGSIETQDSISESDHSKPPSVSSKSSGKNDKSRRAINKQRLLSVGYLMQQLNAMTVEPTERIQEEDECVSLSRPSTMESVKNASENVSGMEALNNRSESVGIDQTKTLDTTGTNIVFKDFSGSADKQNVGNQTDDKTFEDDVQCCGETAMQLNSDDDSSADSRHGVKRSHENENDESSTSIEKVKSAYQLMGLMYDLDNIKKVRKASVCYKKRFSQIRFQNRILRLQKLPNKHIYFDYDDEVCDENSSQGQLRNSPSQADDVLDKNDSGELFKHAAEASSKPSEPGSHGERKFEMEDFSEKDDSTDDDQDVFFSAEEDNLLDSSQERRENKLRNVPKRRKKRQLKKKNVCYPPEMAGNPKIKKFWRRRYSLFSKFDEGIRMDTESWYSVTPEKIAINIADRCQCDLVVDAFCGAGGNAIQLAFTCERVIAIDIDPYKIELARHNARVYGVEDRIEFIIGDFLEVAPRLVADVVFLSPPWGGPSYNKHSVFPLTSLLPVTGQRLLEVTSGISDNIAFYLPRNVNTQELVECAGLGGTVEVVQNFLDRELIAITAYFGELVTPIYG